MKFLIKKSILFFVVCNLLCLSVKAQTVFAPPNAIWYYGFISSDGEEGLYYSKFQVEKDTFYEGHLASKVTSKRYNSTGGIATLGNQYVYTSNDTVFYYNFNYSKFLPLYVFNVKKGDTLKFHVPFSMTSLPDSFRVVVDSVYYVIIDGSTLKRVKTSYLDHFALYIYTERLGNDVFLGHQYISTTGFSNFLSCYQDGIIDVNFTGRECDYLKTSSIRASIPDLAPILYPNPFLEQLTIDFGLNNNTFIVEIFDVFGKVQIRMKHSNGGHCKIENTSLTPGVYFIKITDDFQKILFQKTLLKQ